MKKRTVRRKSGSTKTSRRKRSLWKSSLFRLIIALCGLLFLLAVGFHYRNGLLYYLGFKSHKVIATKEERRFSDVRNFQVLSKYEDKVVGLDVSQYQGKIDWNQVGFVEDNFPLQFVFIRATVGKDKVDATFDSNWKQAHKKLICGAYHYYRPNENSLEQANHFIKNVRLRTGDLPPILDIESMPKNQSIDSLKIGLKRWLEKVDGHYKVRPIIYTNAKFYDTFLKDDFEGYTFWIANYNFFVEDIQDDWLFWQFTESATIPGIEGNVDLNIYNGTPKMLRYLTIN
jgi:lysozyme